jgi:hypothetical protein
MMYLFGHRLSSVQASGLSAALGHEPFGLELMAERLGPNGVSNFKNYGDENTIWYLRIKALSKHVLTSLGGSR